MSEESLSKGPVERTDALARHRERFVERFGGGDDIRLFFSPGRINLMGAHLDYNGGPVMGGTFPALIWARVIDAWLEIQAEKAAEKAARKAAEEAGEEYVPGESEYVAPEGEYGTAEPEPEAAEPAPETETAPEDAAPEGAPEPAPETAPEAAPESGGGGGVTAG